MWGDLLGLSGTFDSYARHTDLARLRPGDLVVDIGAHVGTFSVPLLHRHPGVRVLAFEPDPQNAADLARNAALNGIDESALIIEQRAVTDHEGKAVFARGGSSTTGALLDVGFFKTRNTSSEDGLECETTTLSAIFDRYEIDRCRLLKVDCEGSEYGIFASVPEELLAKVDQLIVEVHPARDGNPAQLLEWFEERGFLVEAVEHGNGCADLFCRRPEAFEGL